MAKPTGIVLYKGPSLIDGGPIVVVANAFKRSANHKTGKMIQVWILREDVHPQDAVLTRADESICGDCIHRAKEISDDGVRAMGGSCYVNLMYGPFAIWRAYKRGTYKSFEISDLGYFQGRHVRIGAYGDPAAVPTLIWKTICNAAAGWTGYTHRWRECDPNLADYCMASADTVADYHEAMKAGWRVFRVRKSIEDPLLDDEMVCPASDEAGKKTECMACGGCSGRRSNRRNVAIVVHGWKGKVRAFLRNIAIKEGAIPE